MSRATGAATARSAPASPGVATVEIRSSGPVPEGLVEAFEEYERALRADDVETLDALFAAGPHTLRGDGTSLLVGHDEIAAFRRGRGGAPSRRAVVLEVRPLADDAVLVAAVTTDAGTRAHGLQTQLWQRREDRWVVTAAHVTQPARPPAVDGSIWRKVGTPLVEPAGSGVLDGLTVAVKDVLAVAGERMGLGNPTWLADQEPEARSAPAVQQLLDAGAAVTGIARTDEFAYSLAGQNRHYGTPPNPAAPGCLSGGSTSGPAAAVALGQVDIGLGTDTAGSLRVPASYQGLVGVRTSHGAISVEGVHPLAPSFDTVGWLTRDVDVAARVADVLLAHRPNVAPGSRTAVIPALRGWINAELDRRVTAALAELTGAGVLAPVEDADLAHDEITAWARAFRVLQAFEVWQGQGDWARDHPGAFGPDVGGRFAFAAMVTTDQADTARETVRDARERLRRLLADTVLVLPASSGPAPSLHAGKDIVEDERTATVRLTQLASLAGAPAVALPVLWMSDGRPVGLCLVGAPDTDRALLALGRTVTEALAAAAASR